MRRFLVGLICMAALLAGGCGNFGNTEDKTNGTDELVTTEGNASLQTEDDTAEIITTAEEIKVLNEDNTMNIMDINDIASLEIYDDELYSVVLEIKGDELEALGDCIAELGKVHFEETDELTLEVSKEGKYSVTIEGNNPDYRQIIWTYKDSLVHLSAIKNSAIDSVNCRCDADIEAIIAKLIEKYPRKYLGEEKTIDVMGIDNIESIEIEYGSVNKVLAKLEGEDKEELKAIGEFATELEKFRFEEIDRGEDTFGARYFVRINGKDGSRQGMLLYSNEKIIVSGTDMEKAYYRCKDNMVGMVEDYIERYKEPETTGE